MKIKNLKCYMIGAMILANSSFAVSCDFVAELKEQQVLDEFLESNNITRIIDVDNMPVNYYESVVSKPTKVGDELVFTSYYQKLDRIDDVVCFAREYDYDYKVLKIEGSQGDYQVESMIIEDIDNRPSDYDYVYLDDYVIDNGYRDVLINYGKILRK